MSDCHTNMVLQQLPSPYSIHQNMGKPLSLKVKLAVRMDGYLGEELPLLSELRIDDLLQQQPLFHL